jgi:hypothetical protein
MKKNARTSTVHCISLNLHKKDLQASEEAPALKRKRPDLQKRIFYNFPFAFMDPRIWQPH